jgi:hypothetical protein
MEARKMKNRELPEICYSTHSITGQVILIKRNESGYYPVDTILSADDLNKIAGVDKGQVEAMLVGSMFGFNVPGANPEYYNEDGEFNSKFYSEGRR